MMRVSRTSAIALSLSVMLTTPLSAQPPIEVWDELPSLPQPITNNAVTSVHHPDGSVTLYSFMGMTAPTDRNSITAASYCITLPLDEAWTRIADAPLLDGRAKIAASAVTVAGRIFLIGGYTVNRAEVTEPRLFEYLPATDTYAERARVPVEVDDTVTGVLEDRFIYLVSGWHGPIANNVSDVQIYDSRDDRWVTATSIIDPLPGLFGHSGTMVGRRLMYFDGVTTTGGFNITDRMFVGQIDPLNHGDIAHIEWREVEPHPGQPTYRAAVSQGPTYDGKLVLTGGSDNPYNYSGNGYNGQPSFPLDQTMLLDPQSGEWTLPRDTVGTHVATMDHRGLVRAGLGWVSVGGMTAPEIATNRVFHLQLVDGPVLAPPVPGIAGESNTFSISHATPGARVILAYSLSPGIRTLNVCPGGLPIQLRHPVRLAVGLADESGLLDLSIVVSDDAAGETTLLQAYEPDSCRIGNLIIKRWNGG